jgi:hypothetical protein
MQSCYCAACRANFGMKCDVGVRQQASLEIGEMKLYQRVEKEFGCVGFEIFDSTRKRC